jgi:hypothetical protein
MAVGAKLPLDLFAVESILAGPRGGGRRREERRYRTAPGDLALIEV